MVKYIYQKRTGEFEKMPEYIYKNRNGCFEIRKRIGDHLVYFGSYNTLTEAKLYRAYYIGKNWIVNPNFHNNKYIHKYGEKFLVVKVIDGKKNYFGTFDNLVDARVERDICVACDWDFDMIVEFDERSLAEV